MKKGQLPSGFDALPTLYFSRGPAPNAEAAARPDHVYNVKSTDTLVREFKVRERTLKVLAHERVAAKKEQAEGRVSAWVCLGIVAIVVVVSVLQAVLS